MRNTKSIIALFLFVSLLFSCTADEVLDQNQETKTEINAKTGGDGSSEPDDDRTGGGN